MADQPETFVTTTSDGRIAIRQSGDDPDHDDCIIIALENVQRLHEALLVVVARIEASKSTAEDA